MNKLVELWIKAIDEREIEEYSKEVRDLCDYTMYLAKKLNQLEANIDDAIGYIRYCQTSDKDIFPVIKAGKMIEILERGKE